MTAAKHKPGKGPEALLNMFYLLRACMEQGHLLHVEFGGKTHFDTTMKMDDGSEWKCKAWRTAKPKEGAAPQ